MSIDKRKMAAVILGHAVADALGVPAEFEERAALDKVPITDMIGFGAYPYPAGCWSDDTSMSLAALDSLRGGKVDWKEIMENFGRWLDGGKYTPTGVAFDAGGTCVRAIVKYFSKQIPPTQCGESDEYSNGNGSLMRINPFVLYAYAKRLPLDEAVRLVHTASALTHAHPRSKIACGIYAFVLLRLLECPERAAVGDALREAEAYYRGEAELGCYRRLLGANFDKLERSEIKSTGYVVDTLEAAVWCLLTTDSYKECVLKAVNLGEDTDTVAAVAGGLAGALYGAAAIPRRWLSELKRRDYIEKMCAAVFDKWEVEK